MLILFILAGSSIFFVNLGNVPGASACLGPGCGMPSCQNEPVCPVSMVCTSLLGNPAAEVVLNSNASSPISAMAEVIFSNAMGEAVFIGTSTFVIQPNGTATADIVTAGLPGGNYTVTAFANDLNDITISKTITSECSFGPPLSLMGVQTLILVEPLFTASFCAQCPIVEANYGNNVDSVVDGVVYMVVLNSLGQEAGYTTATVAIGQGQNDTGYLIAAGLPSGNYSSFVYVISTSLGEVISETSSLNFTIN